MKRKFFTLLTFLGYLCMGLACISGVAYAVYLLGPVGLTVGNAMWGGFLLWLKMFVGGFIAVLLGIFLS